jgi:hypothetical protein
MQQSEGGMFLTWKELHQLWEAARRYDITDWYYELLEDYLSEWGPDDK